MEVTEGVLIGDGDMALDVLQSLEKVEVGPELYDFEKGVQLSKTSIAAAA